MYKCKIDLRYSTLVYPDTNSIFLIQTSQAHSISLFFTSLGEKKGRERVVVWLVSFRCEIYQENERYCISKWEVSNVQVFITAELQKIST